MRHASSGSACSLPRRSPQQTSFCAHNSPSIRNALSHPGAPRMPPASPWSGSGAGSTGGRRWRLCNLRRFSAGIGRDSACAGGGSPRLDARRSLRTLHVLIRRMARENPTWGEERIANALFLKLGLRVSPRTVRKYMPQRVDHGRGKRVTSQRWQTFVRNHAQAIVACDFCMVVTATFRLLYVFVVMEHATRRMLHYNVTAHPTAPWTLQQLREALPADHGYRFLVHDRDSIFAAQLDRSIQNLGLKVLKTPPQSPQANALCERLLGTLRRECVDFMIPLTENHLRRI